jgi:hypothetical protein
MNRQTQQMFPRTTKTLREATLELEHEIHALRMLLAACDLVKARVPHQKGCARLGHDAAECTCIRAKVAMLREELDQQLNS